MKRFLFSLLAVSFFCLLHSENNLVVYFSATGTTKTLAVQMAKAVNADIWEIEPLEPYTPKDLNWRDSMSRSSLEYGDPTYRPTIKMCTDIRSYSTIYLGFPIWWNCCPRIVQSWIENNDLSNKKIIVFATSSSTSIDRSFRILKEEYGQYQWVKGQSFHSLPTIEELQQWKTNIESQPSLLSEEDDEIPF